MAKIKDKIKEKISKIKNIEPKTKIRIIDYAILVLIFLIFIAIFAVLNGKMTGKVIQENYNISIDFENDSEGSSSDALAFKRIEPLGNFIAVNYTFDNSNFIGNWVSVEVWIMDENDREINKVEDVFLIKKESLIEREVWFDLGNQNSGVYSIYIALSDDLNNPIKQSIVLGKSSMTGNTILY